MSFILDILGVVLIFSVPFIGIIIIRSRTIEVDDVEETDESNGTITCLGSFFVIAYQKVSYKLFSTPSDKKQEVKDLIKWYKYKVKQDRKLIKQRIKVAKIAYKHNAEVKKGV